MACNCGCSSKSDCSCEGGFSSEGIQRAEFEAATYPGYKEATGARGCASNKGKFYDLTLEDFIVPEIGREAYLKVCDGKLWKAQQFIAIALSGSKIAAFKITEVGTGRLKVLNGCDKSGENGILGNPEKGYNIPANSVMYPIAPVGCDSGFALQVITVLQNQGTDAVLEILADNEDICFTSAKVAGEDEEVHLFGGTQPDCDCAPDASISSCLRKIIKIFTGQGGRTLCMPEVASVTFSGEKRVAVFDENKCLKRGPTYEDLLNCETDEQLDEDGQANAIMACADGVRSGFEAWDKNVSLVTVEVDDPESDDPDDKIFVWKSVQRDYALIQHTTGAGIDGGATVNGDWRIRPLSSPLVETPGFVSVAGNIITINKPGLYSVEWIGVIFAASGAQTRFENADDNTKVFYGNSGYTTNDTTACGQAIIDVTATTNKRWKMMYRVVTSNATDGLGRSNSWGPNVYCSIVIKSLF